MNSTTTSPAASPARASQKSTFVQKENTGILFNNHKRETDNHPDRIGKALIGGVEYRISAWSKKSQKGNPIISLSFSRSEDVSEKD